MKESTAITIIISLMMLLLGFEASGFQIALRSISTGLRLNALQQGMLVSAQYFAIIIIPPIMGGISDRHDRKTIVGLFGLIFSFGCLIVIFSNSYLIVISGIFLIGCGYSVCESLSVSLFSSIYGASANKYVNISQSMFSVGAVISPLVNAWFIGNTRLSWRILFVIVGGSFLLLSILLLRLPSSKTPNISRYIGKNHQTHEVFNIKKELLLLTFALSILIYAGIEIGAGFFLDSLVNQNYSESHYSALILSAFWFAMIPSRILSGIFYEYRRKILIISYLVAAPSIILFAINTNAFSGFILILLVGFCLGPIWPNLMSSAAERSNKPGLATGVMSSACGIGGVIFPILISTFAWQYGYTNAFVAMGLIAFVGAAITWKSIYNSRRVKV